MSEAAELVSAADKLLEKKLFDEAIASYSIAIKLTPTSPTYYIKRSTAYQRSNNLEDALKDAEQAVVLAEKRGKAELIAAAQLRRGISLSGLKRYADSNAVFQLAKKAGSKDKSIDIWISKNNNALAKLSAEENRSKIDAIPKELPYPVDSSQSGTTDPSKDGDKTTVSAAPAVAPTPAAPAPPVPQRVRHEWYQTEQFVFVDIFFKNIPKDNCNIEIEPNSLAVTFPLPTGSEFTFTLEPLFHAVDPTTSTHEVLSTKLSLKLAKKERGIKWSSLEATSEQATVPTKMATPSSTSKGIAYPTSSRSGAKNWDALEREAVKDAEEWEKPDGDAAANKLFRDLFKNATPEVRRAMEKSYVESNGTALSTDWEKVSKGRVETVPPDSMVAKKWEP